ncbi:putative membrane protein [Nonomuraea endophytica]|uniref:Putative membrane protein n=1 Tax=Nonomuraea endophytica TaxID=714136 RepID=A0A7W8A3S7_9ACTN|nr:putative membrane protein [Nonomuraea endophytica]
MSTALALSAGGVAMAAVPEDVFVPWIRTGLAIMLVALAALAAGMAYPRWRNIQRALRDQSPLPPPALAAVFGYGVAAVAVIALVLIILAI